MSFTKYLKYRCEMLEIILKFRKYTNSLLNFTRVLFWYLLSIYILVESFMGIP